MRKRDVARLFSTHDLENLSVVAVSAAQKRNGRAQLLLVIVAGFKGRPNRKNK